MTNSVKDAADIAARLHRLTGLTDNQIASLSLTLDPDTVDQVSDSVLALLVSGALPGLPLNPSGGLPLGLPGATQPSRYVGATASGPPTTGTFAVGDFVIIRAGGISICTTAGSPGTWQTGGAGTYVPGTLAAQPTASVFGTGFYFATDDNGGTLYRSNGTAWTKQAPGVGQAATPALVAQATVTANVTTTSATAVDASGLSVTWTAVAGATYWVWFKGALGNTVTATLSEVYITDSANAVLDDVGYTSRSANDSDHKMVQAFVAPGAGSVTYKLRLRAAAGTAFILAATTYKASLTVLRVA